VNILAKYAWFEIKNQKKFVTLFVFNIVIGLLGPIFVENFKGAFSGLVESKSRILLGGDFSVSSRLNINPEIIRGIEKDLKSKKYIEEITLFSMVKGKKVPRLVQVKTLSTDFPFYGKILLEDGRVWPFVDDLFNQGKSIFIYPELKLQLGVEKGDILKIGNSEYQIAGFIKSDAGQIFQTAAMAPKIYMSRTGLNKSDLIQKGSTKTLKYTFKSPLSELSIKDIKQKWNKKIKGSGIRLRTASDAGENIGRVVNYLNDFLGLVSLVAIFLSSLGLFYLYSNFLASKRKDMAIYYCIGMKGKNIFKLYYCHLFFLATIGVILSVLLGGSLFLIIGKQLESIFTIAPSTWVNYRGVMLASLMGFVGTPLLSLPLLYPLINYKPDGLFQESSGKLPGFNWRHLWTFVPFFVFCFLLSLYFSNSIIIGSSFFVGFIFILSFFYPVLNYLISKMEFIRTKKLYLNLSLKYFGRFKRMSSLILVSLLMGSLLVVLIPQLEYGLQGELRTNKKSELPSLFLFDVQPDQVEELNSFIEMQDTKILTLSPMVRGKVTKLNDVVFNKKDDSPSFMDTREEQRSRMFRNRSVNLSYRSGLDKSEKIIEGRAFEGEFRNGMPEISLEKRYAKRMGLKVGDEMDFEIFHMPIKAKVVSLRSVRWTSFLPNFFIQFQPGVLEDAPKTFLGAIPSMANEKRNILQEKLFEKFPNVSVVDISQLVERISLFLSQMTLALKSMAFMTFMAGIMVLFSITQHQLIKRQKDILHLKILGVSNTDLKKMILSEFALIGFLGSSLGVVLSLATGYGLSHYLFDGIWEVGTLRIIGPIVFITSLCLLLSHFASRTILIQRPETVIGDGLS
jgi:putative ABC transport system permease protein